MSKTYYKKRKIRNIKNLKIFLGLILFLVGAFIFTAIFFPVGQSFVSSKESQISVPVPKSTVLTASTIKSMISQGYDAVRGFDSTDANQWFPNAPAGKPTASIKSYNLSIPTLGIIDADVTTVDGELDKHLVNYGGTAIPPNKGTAAIFGHSTLPWLFDPKNYKTIFATVHTLKVGDIITVKISNIVYTYKIFETVVVPAESNAILEQKFDDSYITLVTCYPPGTTWKRLLVKARLQKI